MNAEHILLCRHCYAKLKASGCPRLLLLPTTVLKCVTPFYRMSHMVDYRRIKASLPWAPGARRQCKHDGCGAERVQEYGQRCQQRGKLQGTGVSLVA